MVEGRQAKESETIMDFGYYIVKVNGQFSEVEEFKGNEWGEAFERLQELRNSNIVGLQVFVLRGMEIERFTIKKEK